LLEIDCDEALLISFSYRWGRLGIELVQMTLPENTPSNAPDKAESPVGEIEVLALLDLAPVLGRDLHDHIIYWGGGAQAMYGFTAEEALGRISHQLLSSEFSVPIEEIMGKLLSSGRWQGEITCVRKDSARVAVNSQWVLHRNQQHQPSAILEVNHDITARKQSKLANASLAAIVENSPDAIIGEDLEGNIISWNPGAETMFGYTAAEALGHHISILATPEHPEDVFEIIERVKRGEVVKRAGAERIRKDGSHIFVSLAVCPIRDPNRRIIGVAKISHDITEIRNAQHALQLSQSMLAQANENLERIVRERTVRLQEALSDVEHFSHTITHDLRGPLRTLQGFGSLLLEEGEKLAPAETREHVERIIGAARKMDSLITDALNYSRAVRQELPLVPVDPAAVILSTIATYPHLQNHRASIQIEGPLPPVLANQTGLVQCFANLLGNAVKFVRPGVFPRIRIWAEQVQQRVRIWIEDNGIGIAKNFQPKLFIIFQRASHDFEGTGIGLALVKKVLERMGGSTGVESELGQGSRFWIELRGAPMPADRKSA
jgi:PAS domain S-box-containing protein